ncbi:hypothetical protein FXO37_11972 [Capsicum annuum]|nr:hypothetical protein FXO37_11972 [Capsicum annuum]
MTGEYRVYNGIKKWFDRNCNLVLDCPVRRRDLKNILKDCFNTYMVWEDDMVFPNIPDLDSDSDSTIVKILREIHSRGRPQINKNRSSHQYAFRGDARIWESKYCDVYEEGQSSQGRSGRVRWGRRGSRGGKVYGSRVGRGDDANPTEESSNGVQCDTEQLFKAMPKLDEKIRSLQDHLEIMMILVNAMEERTNVIRKDMFDRYRKDQDKFIHPST